MCSVAFLEYYAFITSNRFTSLQIFLKNVEAMIGLSPLRNLHEKGQWDSFIVYTQSQDKVFQHNLFHYIEYPYWQLCGMGWGGHTYI